MRIKDDTIQMMKAVMALGDSRVEVMDIPVSEPRSGEVRIKMEVSGICGSDLNQYRTPAGEARKWKVNVLGHEPVGLVDKLGEGVRNLSVGNRVLVHHWHACGKCKYCLSGDTNLCPAREGYSLARPGSHAEFIIASEKNCFPLPEKMTSEEAAIIACGAGTAYGALKKMNIQKGFSLVVFGLGPVGLSTVCLASSMGANVWAVGKRNARLLKAKELGADRVYDIEKVSNIVEILLKDRSEGFQGVVETSGVEVAMSQSLEVAGIEGTIVYLAGRTKGFKCNPVQYAGKELFIRTSLTLPLRLVQELIEYVGGKKLRLDRMITHRFSIDQAKEAFYVAENDKRCIKAVFVFK